MNWKTKLIPLAAIALSLVPTLASAHGWHHGWGRGGYGYGYGYGHGAGPAFVAPAPVTVGYMPGGQIAPPPPLDPVQQQRGHYELQTTQMWIPGFATQVTVGGGCFVGGFCSPPHLETRWIDGHYEQRQSWVFVPNYDADDGFVGGGWAGER